MVVGHALFTRSYVAVECEERLRRIIKAYRSGVRLGLQFYQELEENENLQVMLLNPRGISLPRIAFIFLRRF